MAITSLKELEDIILKKIQGDIQIIEDEEIGMAMERIKNRVKELSVKRMIDLSSFVKIHRREHEIVLTVRFEDKDA